MASTNKTFKRCGCRNQQGKRLEQNCPRLPERGHGTWYFQCFAPDLFGRSERIRRGGFVSQAAARAAREECLADSAARRCGDGWTVERWLRHWLDTRTRIRPTTRLHYTRDVELVLIPRLGHYRLSELDGPLLRAVFAEIAQTTNAKGNPQSPSALNHLRTTLRAALNLAVREDLIGSNPARHIEIAGYRRPHAQVWTDGRVEQWQLTGEHPAVAVWTAAQLATFLEATVEDSLFAFWWLAALRGLRRGEICGLKWAAVDLDRGLLFVERQRTTAGYTVVEGEPKTAAGRRAVALDKHTVAILRAHRSRQFAHRDKRHDNGQVWIDSGYVFTRKDGEPINPSYATTRFRKLTERAGLPPVRLHDLRHGAASLAHEAGADLKTLQDLLGHSSIVVTADTYTSVLPDSQRRCADATAALVLAAARHTRKRIKEKAAKNRPTGRAEKEAPSEKRPTGKKRSRRSRSRRNPLRYGK
ncbi:integrase [Actinoplanes campanulatus]|uniref:Integrase n=1 Tax=Actinoplanes campanulatus TaxID=113559 RepID=A0A7W5AQJ1_9ACTN|nr:tyrosine-type recombinase/integrase [Actinoplanes campanulatus]MBB3100387.1 integrase [Actinoplanes campanulatus]GGN24536.1 site-specific integrase [Actinoplanes campanulatus]GID39575.1 site-specific integrase [Actinoplanes campanulatus]